MRRYLAGLRKSGQWIPATLGVIAVILCCIALAACSSSTTSTSSTAPPSMSTPSSAPPPPPTSTPTPASVPVTPTLPAPAPPRHCRERHGLPDRTCTPGAINLSVTQASLASTICKAGWTATVRPPSSYTEPLKIRQITQYGYADTSLADYEEDHLVPLELGGSPASPANLWPEPHAGTYGSRAKDTVENAARAAVCNGRQTLAAMQHAMETNWETLARKLGVAATATPTHTTPTHTYAPTRTAAPPAPAGCHPTSPAGNCYKRGQFCPKAYRGLSGTTDSGAVIKCSLDGSRWRWS